MDEKPERLAALALPEPNAPPRIDYALLRYFWPYVRADRWMLALAFAGLVFQSAFSVLVTLVPVILDHNWSANRRGFLVATIGGIFVANLFVMAIQSVVNWLMTRITENVVRRVNLAIFEKVGSMPSEELSFQAIGKFAQRTTGDVMRLGGLVSPGIPQTVFSGLQLCFMLAALFWIDARFAWALPALMVVVWVIVRRVNTRVRFWVAADQKAHERVLTHFIESIGGVRDLVASGRFKNAAAAYDDELGTKRRCLIRAAWWNNLANMVPTGMFSILIFGYYLLRVSGTTFASHGEVGAILSYSANLLMAQGLVLSVFKLGTDAGLAAPSLSELRRLLSAPEVIDGDSEATIHSGEVTFDNVTFAYGVTDGDCRPVIDRVSFQIEPGTFAAIVGQSGSGKSTLFYMMLRLLEPLDGAIRLGGLPLKSISLSALRDYIGFIPQFPFIFTGSIRDNLLMGASPDEVPPERIEHAVRMAQLDELIEKRKAAGGLDAPVGSGGASLSAGERQRIALGRIFLRKPGVIVCDEYTANIDNSTARLIQHALKTEFAGITRVVITHQLYTVRGAECIFVLDDGRIVATGTHDELLTRSGLYKEMWEVQNIG